METTENTNPLERRLDLSIAVDALKTETEARLKRMARKVRMPGFRPGKVPFPMVRQQYGLEAYQEALSTALNEAFGRAVIEQKLIVAGHPRIEPKPIAEGGNATHHEFSAVFEVYPEFVPSDLSDVAIERPVLEVTAVEVDHTLEILRKQRVRFVDADRAAQNEDRVVIDFLGTENGEQLASATAENYPFVLGKGMMLPAFEAEVEGMKAGEAKTFDLTFPEDYPAKEIAGKTLQFKLSLKSVMAPVLPEIDAEFARVLGIADGNLDRMRAEIETNLKREVKKRIEQLLKAQVLDALLEKHPIPVPRALIAQEIQRMMEEARHNMEARGIKNPNTPLQPEWFADMARRRASLGLIFAGIVRHANLQAKPEQVKALVEELAQTYEDPEEVVKWYYAAPDRLKPLEGTVLENSVVDWVLSRAKVTNKTTTFDELMRDKPQQAQKDNHEDRHEAESV
jgi:trigger factor